MRVKMSELELDDLGDEIWEELEPRAASALSRAAGRVIARAMLNLSRPSQSEASTIEFKQRGRVFSRKGRQVQFAGSRRIASAANEPPRMISGELRDSIKMLGAPRRSKYSISQDYGSEHPAAGLHEFGGTVAQNGITRTYPPRPYMRPAEAATADEVDEILRDL
jgi:phage gpG-like protein